MRGIRFRPGRKVVVEGMVEYPILHDLDTGKVLSFWEPGAPIMCNAVKDEDWDPPEAHLRLVAALLPHKPATL